MKRNGEVQPFQREKIENAVSLALQQTGESEELCKIAVEKIINEII